MHSLDGHRRSVDPQLTGSSHSGKSSFATGHFREDERAVDPIVEPKGAGVGKPLFTECGHTPVELAFIEVAVAGGGAAKIRTDRLKVCATDIALMKVIDFDVICASAETALRLPDAESPLARASNPGDFDSLRPRD
jgi:hypothetical protein